LVDFFLKFCDLKAETVRKGYHVYEGSLSILKKILKNEILQK
jgi:hypothetical protein